MKTAKKFALVWPENSRRTMRKFWLSAISALVAVRDVYEEILVLVLLKWKFETGRCR